MTAFIHLRPDRHYKAEAFAKGFEALGHHVEFHEPYVPLGPDDVAVIWNKTARSRNTVQMAREGGGALIVAENGYYGRDENGDQPFALALDGHCGSGRWFVGDTSRLDALNIEFKPWRPIHEQRKLNLALIACQRGIGSREMASPPMFEQTASARLTREGFQSRSRKHPGRHQPAVPLMDDLKDMNCVVVWSSNCATTALIEGIPTYYCAPHIVTEGAALPFLKSVGMRPMEGPDYEVRREAFNRMAWAQAFMGEIESGEALQRLIDVHAGRLPARHKGLGL